MKIPPKWFFSIKFTRNQGALNEYQRLEVDSIPHHRMRDIYKNRELIWQRKVE
ncbi:DUF504 domain-containing protein [Oceanispirochaeta sp. M1]|nr:DUF504 domain-containing protein [Oceanispirochaeta sp. M1]